MSYADCIKKIGLSDEEIRIYDDLVAKHQTEGLSPADAQIAAAEARLTELGIDKTEVQTKINELIPEHAITKGIEVEEITNEEERQKLFEEFAALRPRELQGEEDVYTTASGRKADDTWRTATRVTRNGNPAIIHRGASQKLTEKDFDQESLGKATGHPTSGLGVYLSADFSIASGYGSVVESVHIDIRNPKIYTVDTSPEFDSVEDAYAHREALQAEGYDGIIFDLREIDGPVDFVVFEADQVIYPPEADDVKTFFQGDARTYEGFTIVQKGDEGLTGRGAIKMKDGTVLIDDSPVHATQLAKIQKLGIPLSEVESGGFIRADGSYIEGSADTPRILEQDKAREAFEARRKKDSKKPAPIELTGQGDVDLVETGKPVSFYFIHNTESATDIFGKPKKDAPYGRAFEPSARYINIASESKAKEIANEGGQFVSGKLTFKNPIVLPNDNLKWKEKLSETYGGKTGKALSKAIIADGHDGVITTEDKYITETIDLTTFDEAKALYQSDEKQDLFVAHNLSAENILSAKDLGGLAAPSIAIARTSVSDFSGFGEVTLLADPKLLEDPKARTFDADIYSPRQPRAVYDIDQDIYSELYQQLDPDNLELSKPDINSMEDTTGPDNFLRSEAVEYHWLKLQGKEPKLKKAKVDPTVRKAAKFDKNQFELIEDEKFIKMATDYYQKQLDALTEDGFDVRAEKMTEWYFNEDGSLKHSKLRDLASKADRFRRTGGIDTSKLREDIVKKIRVKKNRNEYEQWATEQFNKMVTGKKIFKGFTPSGNRKYVDYNLQNVVKEMTQQLQAGESFFYGAGTVRSKYANEMKTIAQIQAKRDEIVSEEDMQKVKDESAEVFSKALDDLKRFYKYDTSSWGYSDDAGNAIIEGRKGLNEAFDMTPEAQQIVDDLLEYLAALPTSYFEAKVQRAVGFEEFNTAVIPRGMRKDALKVLKDAGLKIKTYDPKDKASRADVIAKQEKILFQPTRASIQFTKENESIIRLTRASDLSSFLHESGHLFLEMEKRFADKFGQTEEQQTLLDWLEVNSFDEIGVEHHEKFAETFEAYLREGKAPSLKLREAFAAFARWLTVIYRKLTDSRLTRVDLSPEIRQYMDRMLATEAEIEQAMANPAYDQLFRSKEQAGMTDEQWDAHQKQAAKVKEKATTDLLQKVIDELKKRKTKEWKEERDPLIEEELARLADLPAYQILTMASNDPMDSKIVKDELGIEAKAELDTAEYYGEEYEPKTTPQKSKSSMNRLIKRITKKDGVDPAEYAEAFDYTSVTAMMNDINDRGTLKREALKAAEDRMIEKYGDMLNDGRIELEARESIHNDEQAKLLLQEIRALSKGKAKINRAYLMAEAKTLISKMNYKEIKPSKFYRAEIKAAQLAATATTDAEKLAAKTQQIANHYLYREAIDVKEAMDRQRKYVRRVQTREYKANEVSPEFSQNMRTLANLYDLRKKPDQIRDVNKILDWYQAQLADENRFVKAELFDPNLILALEARNRGEIDKLNLPNFDELTADQLKGLYDMIRHLRYVGGQMSNTVKAELAAQRRILTESIIEHGGKDTKVIRGVPRRWENERKNIRHFVNRIPSLRNLTRVLDGFSKDDTGAAVDMIYREIEDSNSHKIELQKHLYEKFENEMGDIHKVGLSRKMTDYTVEDGRTVSFHAESRYMMALYWGTESSREAIREGFGLTDADVQMILSDMTQEQLVLVNSTWNVNESMWPELSKAHVELYGVAPPKLSPTPFEINGVKLTGGHMRLFYDSSKLELKSIQEERGGLASIMPNKNGTMIARVGSGGKPPKLDMSNIIRSLDENIHNIAFAKTANKLRGLLNSDEVSNAIEQKHGDGFKSALIEAVDGLTGNRLAVETTPIVASMFRLLRRAATFKHLAYSLRNTVQQIPAVFVALEEVGVVNFTNNLMRYASPKGHTDMVNFISEKSKFMSDRASFVNREANEYLRKITTDGKAHHMWNQFARYGFTPQTAVDSMIAFPVWMSRYEEGMNNHSDERRAVSDADTAVAESVGSGSDLHLGGLFQANNSEFTKTLTIFGTWFNAYYQRIYKSTDGMTTVANKEAVMSLLITPFIVAVLSAVVIMDMPKDDEETWAWMLKRYAAFMGGTAPILRDIISSFSGFAPKTVFSGAAEVPAKFKSIAGKIIEEEEADIKTASNIIKAVTTVIPVPGVGNLTRTMDYVDSHDRGREGEFNAYQALVQGPTKR